MGLFEETVKHQRKNSYLLSPEGVFYTKNVSLLAPFERFERFLKAENSFDVVRANILIRGLSSKRTLEKLYAEESASAKKKGNEIDLERLSILQKATLERLPSFKEGERKIIVPFLPRSLNSIYAARLEKIGGEPYRKLLSRFESLIVDAFETYGRELFVSGFSRLIPILDNGKILAAYDTDAESLYFINEEGRLDAQVAFFDKDLERPVCTHMIERSLKAAEAYFSDDRELFLRSLLDMRLLSSTFIHELEMKKRNH